MSFSHHAFFPPWRYCCKDFANLLPSLNLKLFLSRTCARSCLWSAPPTLGRTSRVRWRAWRPGCTCPPAAGRAGRRRKAPPLGRGQTSGGTRQKSRQAFCVCCCVGPTDIPVSARSVIAQGLICLPFLCACIQAPASHQALSRWIRSPPRWFTPRPPGCDHLLHWIPLYLSVPAGGGRGERSGRTRGRAGTNNDARTTSGAAAAAAPGVTPAPARSDAPPPPGAVPRTLARATVGEEATLFSYLIHIFWEWEVPGRDSLFPFGGLSLHIHYPTHCAYRRMPIFQAVTI